MESFKVEFTVNSRNYELKQQQPRKKCDNNCSGFRNLTLWVEDSKHEIKIRIKGRVVYMPLRVLVWIKNSIFVLYHQHVVEKKIQQIVLS